MRKRHITDQQRSRRNSQDKELPRYETVHSKALAIRYKVGSCISGPTLPVTIQTICSSYKTSFERESIGGYC